MLRVIFSLTLEQLKDFHLSDDEKEIGTYAGWISKLLERERMGERGKGVVMMGLAAAAAAVAAAASISPGSWLDVARKTNRYYGSRLGYSAYTDQG